MLLPIVVVGIVLYVLPYYCIKLVYLERRKRGISPRCSSYDLKDMLDNE
jgi:hypothetical protein